jgi:hypothetical protein
VKFSSPKNHAQPVGLSDDASVNETGSGTAPEVRLAVKLATGANGAAAVIQGTPIMRSKDSTPSEMNNEWYLLIISISGTILYLT